MNKKEIIEEVVVRDSASTRTSTMTNNALSAVIFPRYSTQKN